MGLLDCAPMGFQMEFDVYYAIDVDGPHGSLVKQWIFDSKRLCQVYSLKDQGTLKNFRLDDAKFSRLQQSLFGRVVKDIRIANDGAMYDMDDILITNIRTKGCDACVLYYETTGAYSGNPTNYTLKSTFPVVSPFNKIDYWKIELDRSDSQELKSRVTP